MRQVPNCATRSFTSRSSARWYGSYISTISCPRSWSVKSARRRGEPSDRENVDRSHSLSGHRFGRIVGEALGIHHEATETTGRTGFHPASAPALRARRCSGRSWRAARTRAVPHSPRRRCDTWRGRSGSCGERERRAAAPRPVVGFRNAPRRLDALVAAAMDGRASFL